jgi:outer membrane protein TolC
LLKSAKTNIDVADKNIEIIKTDKMPTVQVLEDILYKDRLLRNPVLDMYSGGWQTGVSLSYNIDNLYKTKEKVKLGELQKNRPMMR